MYDGHGIASSAVLFSCGYSNSVSIASSWYRRFSAAQPKYSPGVCSDMPEQHGAQSSQ